MVSELVPFFFFGGVGGAEVVGGMGLICAEWALEGLNNRFKSYLL